MKRLAFFLAALALVSGCSRETPRDPSQWPLPKSALGAVPPGEDPGEAAYRRTCIACHGMDGKGENGRAADLTRPDGPRTMTDEALRAVIHDGRHGPIGVMPAHGAILSAAELEAVVAFVRRRYAPAAPPPPTTVDGGAGESGVVPPTP